MFVVQDTEKKTFDFKTPAGEFAIPLLGELPIEYLIKLQELNKDDSSIAMTAWVCDEVFGKFAPGCLEGLSINQVNTLIAAYNDASSAGE